MSDIDIQADDAAMDKDGVAPLAVDPLADLLFNLVAIIVIAVILILPTIAAAPPSLGPASANFDVAGRKAQTLVATSSGIRFGANAGEIVPINHILDDAGLAARLDRIRDQNEPLLLLIEPDGLEAAFLVETVLSRHGPAQIHQVRLDYMCAYARSARGEEICPQPSVAGN